MFALAVLISLSQNYFLSSESYAIMEYVTGFPDLITAPLNWIYETRWSVNLLYIGNDALIVRSIQLLGIFEVLAIGSEFTVAAIFLSVFAV